MVLIFLPQWFEGLALADVQYLVSNPYQVVFLAYRYAILIGWQIHFHLHLILESFDLIHLNA